jgi:hypothetical protein
MFETAFSFMRLLLYLMSRTLTLPQYVLVAMRCSLPDHIAQYD